MFLTQVICSYLPSGHARSADQVIGHWYLDKVNLLANNGKPFFKQDFIVNVGSLSTAFISYAFDPIARRLNSPHVLSIGRFFHEYGDGQRFYHRQTSRPWAHEYSDVDELPDVLRAEGEKHKRSVLAAAGRPLQ